MTFPIQAGDMHGAVRILRPRQRFAGEQVEAAGDLFLDGRSGEFNAGIAGQNVDEICG